MQQQQRRQAECLRVSQTGGLVFQASKAPARGLPSRERRERSAYRHQRLPQHDVSELAPRRSSNAPGRSLREDPYSDEEGGPAMVPSEQRTHAALATVWGEFPKEAVLATPPPRQLRKKKTIPPNPGEPPILEKKKPFII